jgi:hypothetical protein
MKRRALREQGQILIQVLLLSALAVAILTVLVNIALTSLGGTVLSVDSERAFEIAEAGLEYYRWHLAHSPQDFTNGTGLPGPYTIDFPDKNGVVIGQFTLTITPPDPGSTLVVIRSTGKLSANPHAVRTIEAKLAVPSLTKFAVVANDDLSFGPGTEIFGPVHSNGGIHFDGLAHNIVSSSRDVYNDPDHSGQDEFGVHTHVAPVDPFPPASVPERLDVFAAGRQFPLPAIDFDGITATLAQMKTTAQSDNTYFGPSDVSGYEVILHPNDTFSVAKVTSLKPKPNGCSNSVADPDWGIWSVEATTTVGTYPIPTQGVVFFEDNIWVTGKINSARISIASARFPDNPSRRSSITVNNDLLYTNYDGQDVIGLIAQDDMNVGLYSEDDLRIDAAIIAKSGRVGRPYYREPSGPQQYCGPEALRAVITVHGMIATNERYGFSWSCSGVFCSGYANRNIVYDSHLLFNPPPGFPLTSDEYQVISWQEIK